MNAKELAEETRQKVLQLADQLGSRRAAVAELIGPNLSQSWVLKFLSGEISNPTIESISTLQLSLDQAMQRATVNHSFPVRKSVA
jgi:DNA-binding LacI/PurR family transcriptional regulator